MRISMLRALLFTATSVAGSSALAEYTVQVGAYARPDLANSTTAATVAKVYTRQTASGLTRILVGRFESGAQAKVALQALRAAGYRDAFVTRTRDGVSLESNTPAIARKSSGAVGLAQWNHLSADLRAKLVLLDGRPHIKEGDTFTPLQRYLAQ